MTKEAIEAMKLWQSIPSASCQCHTHYTKKGPVPDYMVCERERAWRNYVKIRGEPKFEFIPRSKEIDVKDAAFLKSIPAGSGYKDLMN